MGDHENKKDRVVHAAFGCRTELLTYARSLLGNFAAAEDAVQEAMIVVMNKYDQFQEGTSILAWCRSIVRLEVLRAKRRYQQDMSLAQRLLDDALDAAFDEFQIIENMMSQRLVAMPYGIASKKLLIAAALS